MGGFTGIGTQLRRWNTTSGLWVEIAEIKSISGPTMSKETKDNTSLGTTGGYRTFVSGFKNAGTISCKMNFTRAGYDILLADFESTENQNYEIVLPDTDNTTIEFEGQVTELPINISEDIVESDVTIQISGAVSINSGSGSG